MVPTLRDAGIAGRAENLMAFEREAPRDGVLAAAAADHENFHDEAVSLARSGRMRDSGYSL